MKDSASKKYSMGEQLFELSKVVLEEPILHAIAKPFLERTGELVRKPYFMGVRKKIA